MAASDPFTIETAIQIACQYHRGQLDKAGVPYIFHPLRVMENVNGLARKMAAVLHDTVEDTELTLDELRARGCPENVLEAVALLTREKGQSHDDYVERLVASRNSIAIPVKWADVMDNSNPQRMQFLPVETQQRLLDKYSKVKRLLVEHL